MDYKQQFGQLDPKLKEVYERVMGTSVASVPKASPVPPDISQHLASPKPVTPTPVAPISEPESPLPAGGHQMPQAPTAPQTQTQAISVKPHGHISPIVWILGGLTFVVVYALAWVKIFNLKLPFAP